MAQSSSGKPVHVIRLGTAAMALHHYLRGHDDAVSWTSDVRLAIPFLTADAAKRYAARRLGGDWHVAEVDRTGPCRMILPDEVDDVPEGNATLEALLTRAPVESVLLTHEQGAAMMAQGRSKHAVASSPWADRPAAERRAMSEAWRL